MRSILYLVLVSLGVLANGTSSAAGEDDADQVIGVSLLSLSNPFFKTMADAALVEAKASGYQVVLKDGRRNPQNQAKQVNEFVESEVSAIILCPCDTTVIAGAIRKANDAQIPVFTVDIPCHAKDAQVVSHIATDNLLGGKQAAQAMIEALGEEGGEVAILEFPAAEVCQLRTRAFLEEIKRHNGPRMGREITVVAHLDGGAHKAESLKATKDVIEDHPDLRGIFAINDPSALGASVALAAAGLSDQVTIIGFDGQLEGRRAIKQGVIYADAIQLPGPFRQL